MSAPPPVTFVVPTYNERASLERLYPRLVPVVTHLRGEVVIVDDGSPDGTAAYARTLSGPVPCLVIERPGVRGLATAVLAGIARARGDVVVVMDADGSHPPERVPELVAAVTVGGAEMALGSRWAPGGGSPGLSRGRRAISSAARVVARPLTDVSDPMSGFFAVRKSILGRARLAPVGYKIALEILVRCRPEPHVELPFVFSPREAGASKFDRREVARYLRHLARLYGVRLAPRRRASSTR